MSTAGSPPESAKSSPSYLVKSWYPPPNESPTAQNAIKLVRHWLTLSSFGRHLVLEMDAGRPPKESSSTDPGLEVVKISGGITNILFRVTADPSCIVPALNKMLRSGAATQQGEDQLIEEQVMSFLMHGVGVRFFGCAKADIVDRRREAAMLDYLSRHGLCKRVFWRFEGGQIDEWRLGRSISVGEMQDETISQAIATHLAALHMLRIPPLFRDDQRTAEQSQTWKQIWAWFDLLAETKAANSCPELLDDFNIPLYRLLAERVRSHNAAQTSPMVLCHNDLLCGNIVRVSTKVSAASAFRGMIDSLSSKAALKTPSSLDDEPLLIPMEGDSDPDTAITEGLRIEFIDFEYAAVSERGYDIANHFMEMAGFECDYSLLPSPEFEKRFIGAYLRAMEGETEDECSPEDNSCSSSSHSEDPQLSQATNSPSTVASSTSPTATDSPDAAKVQLIWQEVQSFKNTSHIFWGLWALVQAVQWKGSSQAPCDYYQYHKLRIAELEPLLNDL
eukprot:Blabericola_migrator_1__638@NODE_1159_length_5253_cov_60_233899_g789_i0_p1_GENE_NODE_1159_length_5253_cov_60_233899_g789_i0NODE_1159_length_5253_cov_60_233899_g789_i0_p1_ORF_typecomplete_len504_score87_43Choline_kinase/PF01633_20/3e40APH/PF01636_23/1_6e08APH/PF01636_23/6_1EcKinase/PF02958_20/1_1EcKinase/PF02958_20/2e02_NODE_1159_length_5253_cov_60_233899_g789_i032874798